MKKELIHLSHISKSYDGKPVLDDLDLVIHENEFVTLLGPSGCGKTTTLRILGGFETPDLGSVIFEGKDITNLPPNRRQLNTVFQNYALFTHMTVAENIAFGLRIRKKSASYINDKISYALKLVGLEGFEKLLLDEPLGALDLKLRQDMQYELIRMKNELSITFIYVTHDQQEALTMSDTIVVMNQGYIQQMGTPEEIYNEPENAFVADFIGDSNLFPAVFVRDELISIDGKEFPCVDKGFGTDKPVDVVIRPEDVKLVPPGTGEVSGVVTDVIFKGVHYEMCVDVNGREWVAHSTTSRPRGMNVDIHVHPFNIQVMNKPGSEDEEAVQTNE